MTEQPTPTPTPPWPPAPQVETFPWRRLDRRMLLVNPVVELFKFLPVLLGIFVLGGNGGQNWWQLIGVAIPVTLGLWRYFTTRFRITTAQVELQRGLLGKKVLTARLDRVRAVEVTASPIHRLLGLGKVEIGTASGAKQDDDKFALDGLPLVEARQLRVSLLHRTDPTAAAATPDELAGAHQAGPGQEDVVLLSFDPRWVRYAPLTSSGSVIAAAVLAVFGQFGERISFEAVESGPFDWLIHRSPVALATAAVLVFLVLGAVFSVLGYLVVNWGFTLSRDIRGRSFHVRRGLLTTSETSLERERVRGVELSEPLGLRLVGAGRLAAIVTGVSQKESGSAQLVPPAPREVIEATGVEVIEGAEPVRVPLIPHGPAARRRRYTRATLGAMVLPVVALVLGLTTPVPWWVVLPALLAVPAGLFLAFDRYRRLGHALTDGYLVVRSGSVSGRRDVLQRSGIIGWNIEQSWFQRRAGLVTLVATTAAGKQAYSALDIPEERAIALADAAVPGLVTPFLSKIH